MTVRRRTMTIFRTTMTAGGSTKTAGGHRMVCEGLILLVFLKIGGFGEGRAIFGRGLIRDVMWLIDFERILVIFVGSY